MRGPLSPAAVPVQFIKHVGPARAALLKRLGIKTAYDLLTYFPRRYEDRRNLKKISQLQDGVVETIQAQVMAVDEIRPRRGLLITRAALADESGVAWAIWFNQAYLAGRLPKGRWLVLTGKAERRFGRQEIAVADYEVVGQEETLHVGRIVPFYHSTAGLTQRVLRLAVHETLRSHAGCLREPLPRSLRERLGLMGLEEAVRQIHFPEDWEGQRAARKRLAFEELFLLELGLLLLRRRRRERGRGVAHRGGAGEAQHYLKNLSFSLTASQQRVVQEIFRDMEEEKPMARLLQGEVGSGKTVVAALALVKAVASGYQAALMAPTEVLAEQHYLNLKKSLSVLGIQTELLTGSLARREREDLLERVAGRQVDVLVGTQALIQEGVCFARLGLTVTDEQHRFGVAQRAVLQDKGPNPDVLVMTATPIPRTLAMTYYGDLDLSVLDELPPGRQPIITKFYGERRRQEAYRILRRELEAGRQAYVVCPLVEESEVLEAEAAERMAERLKKEFPEVSVGLLHGRLKSTQKEAAMGAFREGRLKLLVATSVVEVGVDVPNATVILIEGSERFGLAQLHQLRGRVGRGACQSYCLLLGNPRTAEARARLKALTAGLDGFALAEEDLRLRGPGDFFGTRQHGLPELSLADLVEDGALVELARREASHLLAASPAGDEWQRLLGAVLERFGQARI